MAVIVALIFGTAFLSGLGVEASSLLSDSGCHCPATPLQMQYSGLEIGLSSVDKPSREANCSAILSDDKTQASHHPRIKYGLDLESENGLWEVKLSPGKGLGVFARQTIKRGTRIMTEAPLFTINPPEIVEGIGYSLDAMVADIEASYRALDADAQAAYLSCHEHRDSSDTESREVLIFLSNAYALTDGTVGIFPRIAKINHSCAPNAANLWSEPAGRRIVWAGRDILPGEEVTVTYVPLLLPAAARGKRLAQYGFRCGCEACRAAEGTDVARARMGGMLEEMEGHVRTGYVDDTVLEAAEELATLVREEGLADYETKAYRLVAYFASRLGNGAKARAWVEREMEVHRFADPESQYARLAEVFMSQIGP